MRLKIIASISIFLLLFSLAWLWDNQNIREFYDPEIIADDQAEVVEIMPMTNQMSPLPRKYKIFKSREYVRIEEM
jgi:hypothetical protein